MDDKIFNTSEAAAYLNMSDGTLENWRISSKGPAFHKPNGGRIYYLQSDLDAWIKSGRVEHGML